MGKVLIIGVIGIVVLLIILLCLYQRRAFGYWCSTCRKYRWFRGAQGETIVGCEKCGQITPAPERCPSCGHMSLYTTPSNPGRAECNRWTCRHVVNYGL
ncbi:MAG: hypothetical protein PHD51_04575 [Patescibacteria group bacterium]|nr:hypothetical protein [Patescibacteria group bacterium]